MPPGLATVSAAAALAPSPALGGGIAAVAAAARGIIYTRIYMVPGYIMPYVEATPAMPCQGVLGAAGFQMVSLPVGPLPAISFTTLQAQGSSMQAQL